MTSPTPARGSAMPLILGILLLLALGAAGWLFIANNNPDRAGQPAPAETADAAASQAEANIAAATQAIEESEQAGPESADSVETAPVEGAETPAQADAGGNVAIDIAEAAGTRALGNPQAPIRIIEYASLTCSHCAHFHNDVLPEMKSKYIDSGKVYIEFKEFPLNDPALKATLTARCLPADKYDGFVSLLFKTQDHWAGGIDYMAALRQNAKLAGMSDATFEACQNSEELKMAIANNMQAAQDKWKINATPTFVVNDGAEVISGAQPLAEFERVFRKVSGDAIGGAPAVE